MLNVKASNVLFACMLFLAAPLILFLVSWLNFFWVFFFAALIFFLLKTLIPHLKKFSDETLSISYLNLVFGSLLIMAWIIYGGIGKIGYQNFDYVKHNSIYFDLLTKHWPVTMQHEGQQYYLVYYLAYYLIPAFVGKLAGESINVLEIATIVQAYIGLMLVWFLTLLFTRFRFPLLILVAFIFWGGLDFLGNTFFFQDYSHNFGEFPEWWAGASNFQYTGLTDLLYWVPQHAIGGWLITLLMLYFIRRQELSLLPLIAGLAFLWSPFVTIGLVPFLLVGFLFQPNLKAKVEWCFTRYGIFALSLLFFLAAFYQTSDYEQPFRWQYEKMGAENFIPRYVLFLLLEIALPASFIFWKRQHLTSHLRATFFGLVITLCIIPHVYFGLYSDFAMRASIPALFSLLLYSLLLLESWLTTSNKRVVLLLPLFLLLTSYSAISDFYRAQKLKHIELGYGSTKDFDPKGISRQYMGNRNNFFFKLFF